MGEFKSTLRLSMDLKERRGQLETELDRVITEIVTTELKESLKDTLKNSGVKVLRIAWDFQSEYDDEGGTDWYASCVCAYDEKGECIDLEEILVEQTSYDGSTYKVSLDDVIREVVIDYSYDLYDQYITEILL